MFPPQFIVARRIGNNLEIASKTRLLETLGALLASHDPALRSEAVFECLREREGRGSTGLGRGIALPHARMEGVKVAIGAFVRLRKGVDFNAIDDQPVDLAFALLVPESANETHLQLLAGLAAMFSDRHLREQLRQAGSAEEILALLTGWEESPSDP